MTSKQDIHKAQVSILRSLRHSPDARYSTLMRPTGLESDVFKFHLRKLTHQKYVRKLDSGVYELTPNGKELANNLSKADRSIQKQPKLSVAIIVSRKTENKTEYLFQKRLRSPHYGFWSCISGPVQWSETIELTAKRELKKQTGLSANFSVCSFYRKTDYDTDSKSVLEDKLFAIVEASDVTGALSNEWQRGVNEWMSLASLKKQDKYFSSVYDFIDMIDNNERYRAEDAFYDHDEY